ncbi:hypothetical protein CEH05_15790 [Halobacillus halophilus]|uniref:DUF1850 domain-containing protein n=1 Tax=Halobacillus halophilus (strain ATCC 35676 / DSM 2266 / JCM 20832 / KCTC 3685 / LMG 17431 / NBRC 102448 / NCIMB 2269) TaxID=866895 RepID=I0JQW1_HALH3|nr:DUF1850 domain-containing protein [Halobacillus halophilus]ASF40533.1 hypothetical protein CEH05_15790 [Halobacillus halophilus]CCG46531.1 hypothetical protein HBHAL_4189 [Halobacillus halophilus DSM 2266]
MKWKVVMIAAVTLCLGILLAVVKIPLLLIVAEDETESAFLYKEGAEFSIRWTHSVEKEDWEEMFALEDGVIELTATRFKTFGAGVPNDAGEDTFLKDGWVYMTGITQTIGKELALRTGRETNHRVIYERHHLDLKKNHSYRIKVVRSSIWNGINTYISVKLR